MLGFLEWVISKSRKPGALVMELVLPSHCMSHSFHFATFTSVQALKEHVMSTRWMLDRSGDKQELGIVNPSFPLTLVFSRNTGLGNIWRYQLAKCLFSRPINGCGRLSDWQDSKDKAGKSYVQGRASWEKQVVSVPWDRSRCDLCCKV